MFFSNRIVKVGAVTFAGNSLVAKFIEKLDDMDMMTDEAIYSELAEIFHEVFDDDSIQLKPELTANDVEGWDSFKQVEILIAVQTRFGIKLHSREIDGLKNVGDLADAIKRNKSR